MRSLSICCFRCVSFEMPLSATAKQIAIHALRKIKLLPLVEMARMRLLSLKSRDVEAVVYDAFGVVDASAHFAEGRRFAEYIADIARPYTPKRIMEWGCGPGRIIRHMPELLGCKVYGTDYNADVIKWCAANIKNVVFTINGLRPPITFASGSFDCVYAVSVFTHISARLAQEWILEMKRILTPGGVFIFTMHGDACRDMLLPFERRIYDSGEPVIRGDVAEGSRCFLSYYPDRAVERLLNGFEIVRHDKAPNSMSAVQDVWVSRNIHKQ